MTFTIRMTVEIEGIMGIDPEDLLNAIKAMKNVLEECYDFHRDVTVTVNRAEGHK